MLLKMCYGFVCPLSVGKHPGICTLKPMRNTGFQMLRYRIRSTRIFNLPLDSPSSPPPRFLYFPVYFYSSVLTHYHRECDFKTPCVCCDSRCKDFDFERCSDFEAELIRDVSSLSCYAVSTNKQFGEKFCLRFGDNYLPVDTA